MKQLKLVALDQEDLQVMSAALQDAVVRTADMTYVKARRRFALVVNRFVWEDAVNRDRAKSFERRRTGVHFDRVLAVRAQGFDMTARDGVMELLALSFEETDAPAGHIDLVFAGGGTVRLEVECIEAALSDLGAAWETTARPAHPDKG